MIAAAAVAVAEATGQKPKKKSRMDWRFIAAFWNTALFLQSCRTQGESTQTVN